MLSRISQEANASGAISSGTVVFAYTLPMHNAEGSAAPIISVAGLAK